MAEDNFTIKEYLVDMDKRHNRRFDEVLGEQKKTNGRVRELERWRAFLTGAVALALALGLPNVINLFV